PVPPVAQPPSPETTAKRPAPQPAAGQAPAPPPQQPVAKPAPKAPRASVIAAAPMVDSPMSTPGELPGEFASSGVQAAEQQLGKWKETAASDCAYEISGLARFRVNAARDRKGPVAVFRVIPAKVVTVEEMGLSDEVQRLCYLKKGLVLVTGPTGSGKSTTLCALIDLVNRSRTDHIITIEDPIEFVHQNKKCPIPQRQVHVHTDSFKSAL